ncbi:MAG: GtrA family protein [Clostridia bacterium]|nr:GtrA family protein [Clostridia bacterium]
MKINREVINYLIFGILTTAVSILTFQFFGFLLGEELYLVNNILSWIISVSFAFVTNKLWVFESKK